ncbi:hypothetical protein SUGI_0312680 [Cryptomeria japonica]|uniref:DNA polymerase delta subunit 4 n=1 Tax=Cryptomeria japonica TaxID=3369 RepID=UPI002408C64D|nr:DNA polymerase delta subunit 4 [Cryptomeria japonica]GLJ17875.1 hypothetical protein SUGI_0312680 [Cryptomeria japonica]
MANRRSDLRALYPHRKPLNSSSTKLSGSVENGKGLKKENAAISTDSATSAEAALSDSLNSYDEVYEEEEDCVEQILKQFDLDMRYGPCLGLSRMERWQRAVQLGLSPSQDVKDLLDRAGGMSDCVWEGRV